MLDHQDKYMMKAQVHVSKSFAISDEQALPRRKHYCQIYQMINFTSSIMCRYARDRRDIGGGDKWEIGGPSGELDGMPTLPDGRDKTKTVETNLVCILDILTLLADFCAHRSNFSTYYFIASRSCCLLTLTFGTRLTNVSLLLMILKNHVAKETPQRNMVLISCFVGTMLRSQLTYAKAKEEFGIQVFMASLASVFKDPGNEEKDGLVSLDIAMGPLLPR
nr:hypothetical protein [Tanacetum cinerariifolium]